MRVSQTNLLTSGVQEPPAVQIYTFFSFSFPYFPRQSLLQINFMPFQKMHFYSNKLPAFRNNFSLLLSLTIKKEKKVCVLSSFIKKPKLLQRKIDSPVLSTDTSRSLRFLCGILEQVRFQDLEQLTLYFPQASATLKMENTVADFMRWFIFEALKKKKIRRKSS